MPNPYTGTDNDPISAAQHQFLGKDWEKYFVMLNQATGGRLPRMGAQGPGAPVSLAGPGRTNGVFANGEQIGDAESARSNAINAYLSDLTDQNKLKHQAELDMAAHNRAVDTAERERQAGDRAMAIANDPRTSAFGRPIASQGPLAVGPSGRPVSESGSYTTLGPNPNEPQPPPNRQAIAAQMAPGVIAPPAPAPPVTFGAPVKATVNGKATFIRPGSDGQAYDMSRKPIAADAIETPDTGASANPDVADAVTAMKEGTVPPQLPGRASKDYTAILAEAKRQDYDLSKAATDWTATQKHVQTMNGAQQLRLGQAINALPEMLDSVDSLAQQWKGGKFPVLNKANLALAKNGAYGPDVASVATRLEAQIADVTADLGNVYMGGNSPTDHALSLAGKSLNGEWDEKVLRDMVKLAKQNVQIRKNSIANTGVAGASPDNPYGNQPPGGGGTVEMVDPKGRILDVPASDVAKMLAAGAKRAGGG